MYDTKVVCTYMDDDVILETDGVNDDEQIFIRSCIYRQELLDIFGLEEFNESIINEELKQLYDKVKDHDGFKDVLTEDLLKKDLWTNDLNDGLMGFMILYSYDFLYLMHPLICELLETGVIKSTEKLKNAILKE